MVRRYATVGLILLAAVGCAMTTPRPQGRTEFEDVPVPKGLVLDLNRTTIIESPTVKAARLIYKGRVELQSLVTAFRTTLEVNGWHHISSTTLSKEGTTQVYQKGGDSLQVKIYNGWWYTWAEITTTRVISLSAPPRR